MLQYKITLAIVKKVIASLKKTDRFKFEAIPKDAITKKQSFIIYGRKATEQLYEEYPIFISIELTFKNPRGVSLKFIEDYEVRPARAKDKGEYKLLSERDDLDTEYNEKISAIVKSSDYEAKFGHILLRLDDYTFDKLRQIEKVRKTHEFFGQKKRYLKANIIRDLINKYL